MPVVAFVSLAPGAYDGPAAIGDAEVGVRQAKEALDRAEALQKKGVATDAQRDNAVHALDSAKAKLDSAEKARNYVNENFPD